MKILTIGREDDSDIVIDDEQNLISRHHALLRIYPLGSMELVSMGKNGTFVNGKPLRQDIPVRVTRKDVISFAHAKQLNWASVKDPYKGYRIAIIAALVAVAILVAGVYFYTERKANQPQPTTTEQPVPGLQPGTSVPSDGIEETQPAPPAEGTAPEQTTPAETNEKPVPNKFPKPKKKDKKDDKEPKNESPSDVDETKPENEIPQLVL